MNEVATKSNGVAKREVPALPEIHHDLTGVQDYDKLNKILNQEPPKSWIKSHPMAKLDYLPIGRIEMVLRQVFGTFRVTVKSVGQLANSAYVIVTLQVPDPLHAGEWISQDGVGASPLQTDKGAGAIDWDKIKPNAVQIGLPAAESYAVKDAAEKLGKLFGSDLNRADEIAFQPVYGEPVSIEDLEFLFDLKKGSLTAEETAHAQRIISEREEKSYNKLHKHLSKI